MGLRRAQRGNTRARRPGGKGCRSAGPGVTGCSGGKTVADSVSVLPDSVLAVPPDSGVPVSGPSDIEHAPNPDATTASRHDPRTGENLSGHGL
jgi:hypothetical protein